MIILGLDMSSTCIGYAILGSSVPAWGHAELTGDIARRCLQARAEVARLLNVWQPALVVIESPVARFAKAVIPQARVSGAVLGLFAERRTLWQEVTPQAGKYALCDDGAATKREMVEAACAHLDVGGALTLAVKRGKWAAYDGAHAVVTEDEADAYALALAGRAVRVEVAA